MINNPQETKINWEDLIKDSAWIKTLIEGYKGRYGTNGPLFLPLYRDLINKKEFLVPSYLMWRKEVDSLDLLESSTVSQKRKALIRKAVAKSTAIGVTYRVLNPLTEEDFQRFYHYYRVFCAEMGYEELLRPSYFSKRKASHLFLIEVWQGDHYLGGRLVCQYKDHLSTDFRAIARTKEVKEGYDIVCEYLYYNLAGKLGMKRLGRGKELNLRGVGNRGIGMLWNKLKYGYKPVVPWYLPRLYADYSFLSNTKFDLLFFVSIENDAAIWQGGKAEKLQLNFVCGDQPAWGEIASVKEKSPFPVKVWDRDFNLLEM